MYLRTFVLAQLIGWGIGLSGSLWAQVDTVAITSAVYPLDLNPYCEALVDSQERWTIQTAEQGRFQPLDSLSLPLPLSHRLWTRIHVYNQTDSPQVVFLMVGNTDSTVVYWQDGAGRQEAHVGTYTEASNRNLPFAWRSGAKVRFEPKVLTTVYLLVKEVDGRGPAPRPSWRPYGEQSFELLAGNQFFTILLCFFLGGLIFTFIYNLVIAISVRSWAYLYYSLYLLCVAATFYLVGTKEMFPAFGPGVKWQNQWIQALFLSMAALCYLLFGRRFLDTSSLTPRWDYALRGLIGVRGFIVAAMLVSIFISPQAARLVEVWSITWYLPESGLLLVYLVRLTRIGTRVVWFFIVGSVLVFLGSFMPVWLTMVFGILTSNATFILASLSLEVIVFSLGLGYKLRQQQREKLAAEQVLNQELQKVNTAFGRFVPHAFLESLGHESILDVQLGDQVEKEVTVLFSDIRRYTTLAEGMTPQENFNFLNAYLGRMGPIIQAHQGFVNQYYGDGIMALFMHEPADALRAATAMQQSLAEYNEVRLAKGRLPLQIGIGVHTGPLMMGIIGDTLRLEAGVVSDTVNTASRMEGLTKHFGINLLLSDATFQRLSESERGQLRLLGRVIVKGRKQPMPVYQAYGGEPEATQMQLDALQAPFEAAMQTYLQADFAGASSQWEAILAQAPEDGPTQHYLRLSREHLRQGVPEDWNGVEVMLVK